MRERKRKKGYYKIFALYNPQAKKLAFSLHWRKHSNGTWSHICDSVYTDVSKASKAIQLLTKFISKNIYKRYKVKVILISGFPSSIVPLGVLSGRIVFVSYYNEKQYKRLLKLSESNLVGSRRRNEVRIFNK